MGAMRDQLSAAIINAPRDSQGRLLDIYVDAYIVDVNGRRKKQTEKIMLRKVFVSSMQSYFMNAPYVAGRIQK